MILIGLDVGFAVSRRSTGIARFARGDALRVERATAQWASRSEVVGTESMDAAAIDAPYTTAADGHVRSCESVFARGAFQRRCKPGFSHVRGAGRDLRAAGRETARQLRPLCPAKALAADFPRIEACNIIEAFPNAYLGVCLPETAYLGAGRVERRKKLHWLYDSWIDRGLFQQAIDEMGLTQIHRVGAKCERTKNRDERAALICLLTAAGVYAGRYTAVGDPVGGYFFLPPWSMWAAWARDEVDRQQEEIGELEVWVDGSR
jgi:predicted RNase H-like nuclease